MLINTLCHDFFLLPVYRDSFQGGFILIAFLIIDPFSRHVEEVETVFCQDLYTLIVQIVAAQSVIPGDIHIVDPVILNDRAVEIAVPDGGNGVGLRVQAVQVMILFRSAKIDTALIDAGWV